MTELAEQYRKHPFWVLGASPKNTRQQLITRRSEAVLFGQEEAAEEALTALLHPESRLEAEIRWFPMTEATEIAALMRFVQQEKITEAPPPFHTRSFLALFNQVRLCISLLSHPRVEAFTAALYSLSRCADTLIPRQVKWEINEDRKVSVFPTLTSDADVDAAISGLLRETVDSLIRRRPSVLQGSAAKDLSGRLMKEYKDRESPQHNSYFVHLTADALAALP